MKGLRVTGRVVLLVSLLGSLAGLGCAKKEGYIRPAGWVKGSGPASSGQYRAVAVEDLDNDGNTDIIGGSTHPETIAVWYGDGKGGFTDPGFLDVRGGVHSLLVGDLDEDGYQDLAFAVHKGALGVRTRLNQGDRTWATGINAIERNQYQGIETADVNGDGHLDIVAANSTSETDGGIQIWLGDGNGRWVLESGPVNIHIYMDVTLADFDKDGNIDIAGAGWGGHGALRVWLGDGLGGWSPMPPLHIGSYYGVSTGDLDGDGNEDIFGASYQKGIQVFLGDGGGGFRKGTSPAQEGSFWQVLCTDLDGDFRMDLLASSLDSKGIQVWSSKEIQAWDEEDKEKWILLEGRFPSTGVYYEMAISDLDSDGLNDLCAASDGQGVKVWLGTGGFAAQKATKEPVSTEPTAVAEVAENSVFKTVSGAPEYKLGPGDVLEVSVWKGMEPSKHEILIKPDGNISFGFIHELNVNGMTVSELEGLLTEKLKHYIRDPRIDIVVKGFNSKSFSLLGAIRQAGRGLTGAGQYPLTEKATILQLLAEAGGPADRADLREVTVRRKDGGTLKLNLYKAMLQGDKSQDIVIDDGDLVFIPTIEEREARVYVLGEVKSPGVYPFEEKISLIEAISKAGGYTIHATLGSTMIIRGDITRPEIVSADLDRLLKKGDRTQNIVLADRDVVYVPKSFIGDLSDFAKKLNPFLRLLLYPGEFRDMYLEDGDFLRVRSID